MTRPGYVVRFPIGVFDTDQTGLRSAKCTRGQRWPSWQRFNRLSEFWRNCL